MQDRTSYRIEQPRDDVESRVESVIIKGFSRSAKKEIQRLLKKIGLKIPWNLTIRKYAPLFELKKHKPVGRTDVKNISDEFFGLVHMLEVGLYETRFMSLSEGQKKAVLAHELAHVIDLDRSRDSGEYRPIDFVKNVAEQCMATSIFLSRYHEHHAAEFLEASGKKKQMKLARYYMETWAIIVHIRYSNPTHLKEIDQRHRSALGSKAIALMTTGSESEGVDKVIVSHFMDPDATQSDLEALVGSTDGVPVDMPFTKRKDYKRVKPK